MDGYRRGTEVHRTKRRPRVKGRYRSILPIVWVIGGVILLLVSSLGIGAVLGVLVGSHGFFALLVYADVASLRRQGLRWGRTRYLWILAALVLPFVAPAYYLRSGRLIGAENERRDAVERGEIEDPRAERNGEG
ncbi:hypothetical protein [Halegenticoccus tardaugens]|uniref:hypothetical protein n=1 Tax=Halegenticoccus tardaugens TaxID=2071624 RepID=UPI00100A7615|nr:hypothetical protein [Halegenticoccus tardaugens]